MHQRCKKKKKTDRFCNVMRKTCGSFNRDLKFFRRTQGEMIVNRVSHIIPENYIDSPQKDTMQY